MSTPKTPYYHCYVSANDSRSYYSDLQNLLKISRMEHGIGKLKLYVVISKVRPFNFWDKLFMLLVKQLFKNHNKVELQAMIYKTNLGRDFSSFAIVSDLICNKGDTNAYVFFQNRSGHGPFKQDWYTDFIKQFEAHNDTALCGSTINFNDHPLRSDRNDMPHVQTYAFLTQIKYLKLLQGNFPGVNAHTRLDAIYTGEIALSRFFLNKGLGISCMEWPKYVVTQNTKPNNLGDVRGTVRQDHAFYHKAIFSKTNRIVKTISYLKILFVIGIKSINFLK
ncbi:hypothetical protein [Aestuariivivens marinum]|uniref:hypothetical protein n=1 Tax=Aestuariivivens marinum TaxID=2913555 RepID=UPI001F565DB4|nr:hypothetical protein [Aestuariivivens marinum]